MKAWREIVKIVAALSLLLSLAPALPAFASRDPLAPAEIAQLRDAAQDTNQRLHLFVSFIHARAISLDALRSDPRFSSDRDARIHNLLEEITALVDEMDDNLDQFAERKADLRKPLKEVVDLDSELQSRLQSLKSGDKAMQPASDIEGRGGPPSYAFALNSAIDSVHDSLDHARRLMEKANPQAEAATPKK